MTLDATAALRLYDEAWTIPDYVEFAPDGRIARLTGFYEE